MRPFSLTSSGQKHKMPNFPEAHMCTILLMLSKIVHTIGNSLRILGNKLNYDGENVISVNKTSSNGRPYFQKNPGPPAKKELHASLRGRPARHLAEVLQQTGKRPFPYLRGSARQHCPNTGCNPSSRCGGARRNSPYGGLSSIPGIQTEGNNEPLSGMKNGFVLQVVGGGNVE